ncbi:MAG: hypothetical protein FWH47_00135 [Methanomassiliicoccaceae archaeon]|nr:hypothetical protein [Methanomassiliicoccaceae archaeon]
MDIEKNMNNKELFPLTQSFGLVLGDATEVADAIFNEMRKYTKDENGIELDRPILGNFDDAIYNNKFTVPITRVIAFPTRTEWTIIWNNSFLCDGWDSLCYNLTRSCNYDTFHFCSHDAITTMLPGSYFYYRWVENEVLKERYAWACKNDSGRWEFIEKGETRYFETVEDYEDRMIKNRLNEDKMEKIFDKMGINPWERTSYRYNEPYFQITRTKYPETTKEKDVDKIIKKT